jgi:hypothetical protein
MPDRSSINLTETNTGTEPPRDFPLTITCGAASRLPLNPLLHARLLLDFSILVILNPLSHPSIIWPRLRFFQGLISDGTN